MKNSITAILLSVTLAFAAFVAGFYFGQSTNDTPIEISGVINTVAPATQKPTPTDPATEPSASVTTPAETTPTTMPPSTEPSPETTNATTPATAPEPTEPTWPININTATLDELDAIPDIGPVLAQRILDYREEIGGFTCVEELLEVKGIGEKTLENILQYITV